MKPPNKMKPLILALLFVMMGCEREVEIRDFVTTISIDTAVVNFVERHRDSKHFRIHDTTFVGDSSSFTISK